MALSPAPVPWMTFTAPAESIVPRASNGADREVVVAVVVEAPDGQRPAEAVTVLGLVLDVLDVLMPQLVGHVRRVEPVPGAVDDVDGAGEANLDAVSVRADREIVVRVPVEAPDRQVAAEALAYRRFALDVGDVLVPELVGRRRGAQPAAAPWMTFTAPIDSAEPTVSPGTPTARSS